MFGVEVLIMLAMIGVNSLFAAYEIALASISTGRLQILLRENRAGAKSAAHMKQNMEGSLAAVQLGITLVGAIAAATGGAGAQEWISPFLESRFGLRGAAVDILAIATVVLPFTVVAITFGELVPKIFALRNREWVCLRMSPAMHWFAYVTWPAVRFFEVMVSAITGWGERRWKLSLEGSGKSESAELKELHASAFLARTARLIGAQEERIILGAARLSSRPVREILLPAESIRMMNTGDSLEECLVTAHLDMHTRFPVTGKADDAQSIVGYVNFKDIVAQLRLVPHEASLKAITRAIPSFRDDTSIAHCMEGLIRDHNHIALIRDGAARILGMVTMEDIIEELVGDIQDEYDRLPAHAAASGSAWVAGGGISLDRLKEITSIDLAADMPATGARNLSEWISGHLEQEIHGGEVFERKGVRIAIRKIRRQKTLEAQLSVERPGSAA